MQNEVRAISKSVASEKKDPLEGSGVGWEVQSVEIVEQQVMRQLEDFRIYYNQTIYPELKRMERARVRLLRLILVSTVLLLAIALLAIYLRLWLITLFISLPVVVYLTYLGYRIRQFILTFKPNVTGLILDFIDDGPNLGTLHYDPKAGIDKSLFQSSRILHTSADIYYVEDRITGRVGEMPFELCEMRIEEKSPVRSGLVRVFKGIFMQAIFPEDTMGQMVVWPREYSHFLMRTIKAFTRLGADNVEHEIMNEKFNAYFVTYATLDTHVAGILSPPMQEALVHYREQTGKPIYISFFNREINVAIEDPQDILEPNLFRSNLSFELVREYFESINSLLTIVEIFDQTH